MILLSAGALDDQRTVQMLAALRCQINAVLLAGIVNDGKDGFGTVHIGIVTDRAAGNLTRRAADNKNLTGV